MIIRLDETRRGNQDTILISKGRPSFVNSGIKRDFSTSFIENPGICFPRFTLWLQTPIHFFITSSAFLFFLDFRILNYLWLWVESFWILTFDSSPFISSTSSLIRKRRRGILLFYFKLLRWDLFLPELWHVTFHGTKLHEESHHSTAFVLYKDKANAQNIHITETIIVYIL